MVRPRAGGRGFRPTESILFLTRENVPQFAALVDEIETMGIDETAWMAAQYCPTRRGRRYEQLRPELDDLLPLADRVQELSIWHRDVWGDLETHTEAAYREQALNGDESVAWSFPRPNDTVEVVCRGSFDLHSGLAGLHGPLHGNLKADDPGEVFAKALAHGRVPMDDLYFSGGEFPPARELAERFGDPDGQRVHFSAPEVRWLWLDRALADQRRH